jgi:hypothetical protein
MPDEDIEDVDTTNTGDKNKIVTRTVAESAKPDKSGNEFLES